MVCSRRCPLICIWSTGVQFSKDFIVLDISAGGLVCCGVPGSAMIGEFQESSEVEREGLGRETIGGSISYSVVASFTVSD